jgi:hypothetical protein
MRDLLVVMLGGEQVREKYNHNRSLPQNAQSHNGESNRLGVLLRVKNLCTMIYKCASFSIQLVLVLSFLYARLYSASICWSSFDSTANQSRVLRMGM